MNIAYASHFDECGHVLILHFTVSSGDKSAGITHYVRLSLFPAVLNFRTYLLQLIFK